MTGQPICLGNTLVFKQDCSRLTGAMYVHNKSHCLDLAIVHSCNNVSVRNAMSTVQEVTFAFDYSGKKLQAFFDELDADATTKENMGGGEGEKITDPL